MKCVKVACIRVCVQMDSLSFESFMESCLTGVGSLQDRLKLFALRSANASEVERWSRTHTWCPMILADCGLHHILSNTPTTTSYTHISHASMSICSYATFETHIEAKWTDTRPQSLVYRSQWCKTVDHLSDKHAKIHMLIYSTCIACTNTNTQMELCSHSYCTLTHWLTLCFHSSAAHHS